jgi:Tfp pilus assembly protein PilO
MMSFRDKNQALPTGLWVFSAVVLTGTLIYIVDVKVPTDAGLKAAEKKKEKPIIETISKAKEDKIAKDKVITSLTFPGQSQDAQSTTLAQVTKLSVQRKVKLVGFRPQRGLDAGALTQLPFLVTVSGKFTDVLGFTHDLEASGSKLAVNLVQLAASDPSSDDVTANINVVGYLNQPLGNGGQNG